MLLTNPKKENLISVSKLFQNLDKDEQRFCLLKMLLASFYILEEKRRELAKSKKIIFSDFEKFKAKDRQKWRFNNRYNYFELIEIEQKMKKLMQANPQEIEDLFLTAEENLVVFDSKSCGYVVYSVLI